MKQAEIVRKADQIWTSKGQLVLPYRQVNPTVTESDYWIATNAMFENTGMSREQFDAMPGVLTRSDSGSEYKVIDGVLYRCSNHWGRVASCVWDIDNWRGESGYIVGRVNIADMQANDRGFYIAPNPHAAQIIEKTTASLNELLPFASEKTAAYIHGLINRLNK